MVADSVALDFTGVKPFEPLDPNVVYLLAVDKMELGESKQKKPKVHMELTIIGPEQVQVEEWDAEGGSAIGLKVDGNKEPVMTQAAKRKLFREFSLEEKALPFLHDALKAINPDVNLTPKDKKGESVPFSLKPAEFLGLQVAGKIQNEAYEGTVNARLKKLLPASAYSG